MSALFGDPRLPERFWAKVRVDDATGCWLWTAARKRGYGVFHFDGRQRLAHRLAFQALVGPVPEGLVLDHFACDNPPCCNPEHVRPATVRENTLRSRSSFAGINSRKTHCHRGHPLDGEHLMLVPGGRQCRTCRKERDRERKRARYATDAEYRERIKAAVRDRYRRGMAA